MGKNLKIRVMLHIIMPNQVSGPNNAAKLIAGSFLNEKYEFGFLIQEFHAGGKINFSLISDLKKQIKVFNPDIIHLSGLQSSGFHAAIAAKLCRKKVILAVRGSSTDALGLSKIMKFIFGKIVEPATLRICDKIYTVCQAMENRQLIQANTMGRLIGTIHNSAPEINVNQIKYINLKENLGIDGDSVLVVVVGRIVYDKGVTFIAKAIKAIENEKVKFLFVGDKPTSMDLEISLKSEVLDNRVFFLGKQDGKAVLSILKEADIFLFATLHENLSNALLEAAALGLAIVATNVGGNPEVIENDVNGLIIEPRSSTDIVKAVNLLAEDHLLRAKLGANARQTAEAKFSQAVLLERLNSEYQKML